MCRKFLLSYDPESIFYKFRQCLPDKYAPLQQYAHYEPGQQILALTHSDKGALWYTFHWGLIPHWYNPLQHHFKFPYNARCEGIESRPMFKGPIRTRRCLIPASGFYEGSNVPPLTQAYILGPYNQELFAFAGIWDTWQDPDTQNITHSTTIITGSAFPQFKFIHHRLPVIIAPHDYQTWLTATNLQQALALCRPPHQHNTCSIWHQFRAEPVEMSAI